MPQQTSTALADATLTAAVGPGQPNKADDVKTVQRLLAVVFGSRGTPMTETGAYDAKTLDAVATFERLYFNGVAHPFEADGDSFISLKSTAMVTADVLNQVLGNDMYQIAATMVPGGVPLKRRTRPTNGGQSGDDHIRKYLPLILKELDQRGLGDIDMFLMALASIRAESSHFEPIDEGIYGGHWDNKGKYHHGNTTMKKDPSDRTGRKETRTPLTHIFDVYDNMNGNLGCTKDGDNEVCDGATYHGRGFIQLTGRGLYDKISRQLGFGDLLVKNPDKANDPAIAAAILAQYLKNNEAPIRDALKWGNLPLARRKVNGGSNGLSDFIAAFNAGRQLLHMSVLKQVKKMKEKKKTAPKSPAHPKPAGHGPAHGRPAPVPAGGPH